MSNIEKLEEKAIIDNEGNWIGMQYPGNKEIMDKINEIIDRINGIEKEIKDE